MTRHVLCLVTLLSLATAVPAVAAEPATGQAAANEAAAMSIVARGKADAGEFAVAADQYRAAYRIDPKVPAYVYSSARCFHRAGQWQKAVEDYERYLAFAPKGDPQLAKAQEYLTEARVELAKQQEKDKELAAEQARKAAAEQKEREEAARQAAAAAAAQAMANARANQAESTSWQRPAGFVAVSAGVASLAAGAVFFVMSSSEVADLKAKLTATNNTGLITGITRDQALAEQSTANVHKAVGGALLGAGAVLGGLGAYWLLTGQAPPPQAPALHVGPGGAQLSWRF